MNKKHARAVFKKITVVDFLQTFRKKFLAFSWDFQAVLKQSIVWPLGLQYLCRYCLTSPHISNCWVVFTFALHFFFPSQQQTKAHQESLRKAQQDVERANREQEDRKREAEKEEKLLR